MPQFWRCKIPNALILVKTKYKAWKSIVIRDFNWTERESEESCRLTYIPWWTLKY